MWEHDSSSVPALLALAVTCHAPALSARVAPSQHGPAIYHAATPATSVSALVTLRHSSRADARFGSCFIGRPEVRRMRAGRADTSRRRECSLRMRSSRGVCDGFAARRRCYHLAHVDAASKTRAYGGSAGGSAGPEKNTGRINGVRMDRAPDSDEDVDRSEDEPPLTEKEKFDAMWSRAVARSRDEEAWGFIDDPIDYAHAKMPELQERMRASTGREGVGAGYEDVEVGFYRDTNLKPLTWRDAMVSMKPGSGTKGLNLDPADYDYSEYNEDLPWKIKGTTKSDEGHIPQGGRGALRRREDSASMRGSATDDSAVTKESTDPPTRLRGTPRDASQDEQSRDDTQRALDQEKGRRASNKVRTRYGGPAPGDHGPWRWKQLEKGSPLHKKLEKEIASFPRRLPWRLRRYFDDKIVWVTGADGGLGERLAINLTVNGAKVILTGLDLRELERVQRLCILAWMKAVDWDLFTAFLEGWTRLNRAMVLPMDVEDAYFHQDAAKAAERMLQRPVSILFCCPDEYEYEDEDDEGGEDDPRGSRGMAEDLDAMDRNLWAVASLTKAVLPSMLDNLEGHVVVFGDEDSSQPIAEGASAPEVASKHALRGYFDSLRAEVARDNVGVTLVHPGNLASDGGGPLEASNSPESPAVMDPDHVARRILVAVAKGRGEVFIEKRGLLGWVGFGRAKRRKVLKALAGLLHVYQGR